jgi:uncharacterized protein
LDLTDAAMTRALILSGGGEYSDPWHPFAQTSARLAEVLRAIGHDVEISDHVARRLADLRDVDVIVVNAAAGPVTDAGAARAGLLAALARGLGVLAVHVGACTLLRLPEWESVTGAAWVPGQSMHPKSGPTHVITHQDRHTIVAPICDFDLVDERYTYLRLTPDLVPLASHQYEGRLHPLVWAREHGQARVVVDALGHDLASYDSAEHCRLIARAAGWLTARC